MLLRRWSMICAAALICLPWLAGCGGSDTKGINRGKDKPVLPKEEKKATP